MCDGKAYAYAGGIEKKTDRVLHPFAIFARTIASLTIIRME
jgi:hypothetical protein